MKPESQKILEKIHLLMRRMELQFEDSFKESDLHELNILLQALSMFDEKSLQKISEIQDHFSPGMSLRHFMNFLIPIERALGRTLKDSDFLITREDRPMPPRRLDPKSEILFICDNIRSAFNVGSFFRLADCVSAKKLFLTGYTPSPENEAVLKTSLGADKQIQWQSFPSLELAVQEARNLGFHIYALETAKNAQPLYEVRFPEKSAFVVGNERFGLENSSLNLCDTVIEIPTFGIKNSLNAANALSVAAYEWIRQQHRPHEKPLTHV